MTRLLDWVFKNRLTVVLFFALGAGLGLYAVAHTPVDAVPDITPVQVVVNTKTGALDPEQIEKTVSFPIETDMSGISRVKDVRSLSKYGLSQVVVILKTEPTSTGHASRWANGSKAWRANCPKGLSPELAPISTGLGEVLMYAVLAKPGTALAAKPERERLLALRTIQDFVIAPYMKRAVKNVAEVDSTGGYKKEIHIEIHPERLDRYGLTIEGIAERSKDLGRISAVGTSSPKDGR
jgi:cobalt-zinc-cadmium resistance protein CzcA